MITRLKPINSFTLAVGLVLLFGGVAYALTQVTRGVSATVDVQVSAPNGIEIYLDAARTLPANNISFGTVVVDPFGTPADAGGNPVPVWVENQSNSIIELTLTDDFTLADVALSGPNQAPILQPGEVLPVELLLNFHQGVTGTYPFTMTFQAEGPVISHRDSMTLVVPEEPVQLNSFRSIGSRSSAVIVRDNLVDDLTWQSGDDQRIVPTGATTGWEQLASDKWRFNLRQGVKFHDGEPWNAEAALPSSNYQGDGSNPSSSFPFTGGFTAEASGEHTLDINCDTPCPILPNTTFFLSFLSPEYLASTTEEEQARQSIGFGPYKFAEWRFGVDITMTAYEDYVPGDHFEFEKPRVQNLHWVWRSEPTVMRAMVQTGEADIALDVGVDAANSLPANMIKAGSSAETFAFTTNTLWHPELKKPKVRQAIVHAINCQELVDVLYSGLTTCRGNIIWPGVIGANERNTAPYEYNPSLARALLTEAGYDPANSIEIMGRGARFPKQVEVYEATRGYLDAVGITSEIIVVEPSLRRERTSCGIGKAVNEVLAASGRDPSIDQPNREDFQAAIDQGGADCRYGDLIENELSNETLDFGRQANLYMNCISVRSLVCDPSAGGFQDQIPAALSASSFERQVKLEALADQFHDQVLFIPFFDLPVIYAVDPKLNWDARFDGRVRASTMWFSE